MTATSGKICKEWNKTQFIMLTFFFFTTSLHTTGVYTNEKHTAHKHSQGVHFQIKFVLISIREMWSYSLILTCWALFCSRCLWGFYRTPVQSNRTWSVPSISFQCCPCFLLVWSNHTRHQTKPWLFLSTYMKASVDAFIMLRISPAPFIHVTAFPQRCAHIKRTQPCHLHRSACTPYDRHAHTKRVHISMLSWVCERQLGVNCARVWRNEDWWLMPAVYSRRVSSDSFGSR